MGEEDAIPDAVTARQACIPPPPPHRIRPRKFVLCFIYLLYLYASGKQNPELLLARRPSAARREARAPRCRRQVHLRESDLRHQSKDSTEVLGAATRAGAQRATPRPLARVASTPPWRSPCYARTRRSSERRRRLTRWRGRPGHSRISILPGYSRRGDKGGLWAVGAGGGAGGVPLLLALPPRRLFASP